MPASDSRISPTAHYTSYVWVRNQLSHPALASPLGRRLYRALWPAMALYKGVLRRPNVETMLLARHGCIDELLTRAVDSGQVGQVVEIAAGFSARGWRFKQKYPRLTYLEGDLLPQAAEKRRILDGAGLRGPRHEVLTLDALVDEGPESLAEIARTRLDPRLGCAVITEGLVGYFDRDTVVGLWRRIAKMLTRFAGGLYLSDLTIFDDLHNNRAAELFRRALQAFTRGQVHLHFASPSEAERALGDAGFPRVKLHWPSGHLVRVVEAAS